MRSEPTKTADVVMLEAYLRQLNLKTFAAQHADFAQEAATSQASYTGFLLALAGSVAKNLRGISAGRIRQIQPFWFTWLNQTAP